MIKERTYFVHTVVEEGQAGVFVTDKGAFLNKTNEHLGFGHQCVELLVWAVSALQEPWGHKILAVTDDHAEKYFPDNFEEIKTFSSMFIHTHFISSKGENIHKSNLRTSMWFWGQETHYPTALYTYTTSICPSSDNASSTLITNVISGMSLSGCTTTWWIVSLIDAESSLTDHRCCESDSRMDGRWLTAHRWRQKTSYSRLIFKFKLEHRLILTKLL